MNDKLYCEYICNNCKKINENCIVDIVEQTQRETTTWKCSNFEPIYFLNKDERARMAYQIFNSKK